VKRDDLSILRCPKSKSQLDLEDAIEDSNGEIKSGALVSRATGARYPIRDYIPRFVPDDGYAASFGKQWNRYRLVQLDSANDFDLTEDRFYRGTEWTREELAGQRVLEVGSGAGRFTQILLRANAQVFSGDYSSAVDANWKSNGPHPNLCLFQGDIYELPVREAYFDKVFCYGVLQHTPDVKRAFMSLVPFLKPGGKIAIDVYNTVKWPSRWSAKYVWRPLTTRMRHEHLFNIVEWYVPRWLKADTWLRRRVPARLMRYIDGIVPCNDYRGADWARGMSDEQLEAWAVLDTFDALSPKFDSPQDAEDVITWLQEAQLCDIYVGRAAHGNIKGNASRSVKHGSASTQPAPDARDNVLHRGGGSGDEISRGDAALQ
jgi:SAM-dependent methyltransferase